MGGRKGGGVEGCYPLSGCALGRVGFVLEFYFLYFLFLCLHSTYVPYFTSILFLISSFTFLFFLYAFLLIPLPITTGGDVVTVITISY